MRRIRAICIGGLLQVAGTALAQGATAPATPTAPATQRADSNAAKPSMAELRLAAFTMPSDRHVGVAGTTTVNTSSPSFTGAEFVGRTIDGGAGLHVRYFTAPANGSGLSAGALKYLDGRLMIGSRGFALELGYLLRTQSIAGKDSTIGLARAGFRTEINLGSSGITAGVAASYMRVPAADKNETLVWGIDGETSVLYAFSMLPVYVQLGFRRETYSFETKGFPVKPEELSTIFLGAGVHLGLR